MITRFCALLLLVGLMHGPILAVRAQETDALEVVDFRNVALAEAMRLLSLQTDLRIVPSAVAGKEKVNLFLTNVAPDVVLKALADSNRFVLEKDSSTGVVGIFAKEEARSVGFGPQFGPQPKGGMAAPQVFPKVVLKGRILNKTEMPAVFLEVEGRLIRVARQGMFSMGGLTYIVEEVDATEVRIKEIQRNQVLILN